MGAVSWPAKQIGKAALAIAVFLASPGSAQAQVGLTSRESRVALIARVPSGASVQSVGSPRVIAGRGSVREATVTVRLASTSGYRLLVRTARNAQPVQRSRVWVRGVDGRFHELREGSPVTVAYHQKHAGESERDIVDRVETAEPADDALTLPVRYEIAVNPAL